MEGAHGVLLSIAGGSDLGLFEINEAASLVSDAAHQDANIIFGTVIDDALGEEVRVTVIAAGFDGGAPTYRQMDPPRTGSLSAEANSPAPTSPAIGQPSRQSPQSDSSSRVVFDDVDVPDFLKNGA